MIWVLRTILMRRRTRFEGVYVDAVTKGLIIAKGVS